MVSHVGFLAGGWRSQSPGSNSLDSPANGTMLRFRQYKVSCPACRIIQIDILPAPVDRRGELLPRASVFVLPTKVRHLGPPRRLLSIFRKSGWSRPAPAGRSAAPLTDDGEMSTPTGSPLGTSTLSSRRITNRLDDPAPCDAAAPADYRTILARYRSPVFSERLAIGRLDCAIRVALELDVVQSAVLLLAHAVVGISDGWLSGAFVHPAT